MRVLANGIDYEVHEHRPETVDASKAPVVLLHGFMDAGGTWKKVATHISAAGYHVFAPDLRGFGDSGRVPSGGYYHFADYVADVADLVEQLAPNRPIHLVGHSMGGTVATLFAGTCPERVAKLAILEGLGPFGLPAEAAPLRMRKWLDDLETFRAQHGRDPRAMSEDDAVARLKTNHPRVPESILREQVGSLSSVTANGLRWKFDPLHRTTSPMPFTVPMFLAFAQKIACPTLFVTGGSLGYRPPDEEERLLAYQHLDRFDLPNAGHMMHWTEPDALAERLLKFFA